MAFNVGAIQAHLELDLSRFNAAVRRARTQSSGLGGRLGNLGTALRNVAGRAAKAGAALGVAGLAGGVAALTAALISGSRQQAEYERAVENLRGTLERAGVEGFDAVTANMQAFATELQRITGVSDTATVRVAQTLAAMGVAGDELPEATEAVLDYSAAMGRDAVESAKQLGRSLSGLLGELGESLPAVRELTEEQLKQGAAFDVVRQQFGGLSRELGETFSGRLDRVRASFDDLLKRLGAALNRVLGPALSELQESLDFLVEGFGDNSEAATQLRERFQAFADSLTGFFRNLPSLVTGAVEIVVTLQRAWLDVKGTIQEVLASLFRLDAGFQEFRANVASLNPLADQLERDLRNAAEDSRRMAQHAAELADSTAAQRRELTQQLETLRRSSTEVQEVRNNMERSSQEAREFADAGRLTAQALGLVSDQTDSVADGTQQTTDEYGNLVPKVNEAADAILAIKRNTDDAVTSAGSLVDRFAQFNAQAQHAAQFRGQAFVGEDGGGGGGGSGGGDSGGGGGGLGTGGFHAGPSTSLDFSDPFAAAETLRTVRGQGPLGPAAFQFQINARENLVRQVTNEASAVLNRAVSDLTNDILRELNAQGITDPQERSRVVEQRLREAERLGIIPDRSRFSSGGGGAALF